MGHGKYIAPPPGQYEVGAGERLELEWVVLPGRSEDITVTVDLNGPGAEVFLRGLYICSGDERVRFRIVVHHKAPGCISRQRFCGVAGGRADVRFDGTIVVAPDAQQTEAYQENHTILLSETAQVGTQPQLEIYADDVKCSHGATVGQLDREAQFYLRSRGIPEAEARTLLILSFLSGVTPEKDRAAVEAAVRSL